MTPCVEATSSWWSTGNFIHGLLDKGPTGQQVPPQHKSILDDCDHTGWGVPGVFPLFQSYRHQGLLQSVALCAKEKQQWCKRPAQKAALSPLQKPKATFGPWEDKPEPWNKLPSSHFHIQMAVMKQGNMVCLSLSEMTKPHWWIMLIPSCLNPSSSWVHYSSLWLSKDLDFPSDVWFCWKIWEMLKGINYSFHSLW